MIRLTGFVLCAAAFLAACSGSHSASPAIPADEHASALRGTDSVHIKSIGSVPGDVVAIDAGGTTPEGGFAADVDYATSSWVYSTTKTIDTSAIASPAPMAVYQTMRQGGSVTYTIPGLTPSASYSVRLSFIEPFWQAKGQREFNIAINGTQVAANFDIFATAGAQNKAITETYAATASASGTIAIVMTPVVNYPLIAALEVLGGATPAPTATPTALPTGTLYINAGGTATGKFLADEDYTHAGTWPVSTTQAIITTGVSNPAPQAVYQSQRTGPTVTYTIPGLTPGAAYSVRLDFAEIYFTAPGERVFNVSVNNTPVLSNFDILAAAGAAFSAIAEVFPATASSTGTIVVSLTAVTNNAAINGLEIIPNATPSPVSFNDYTTFGFDNARDVYNPNSTTITPSTLGSLHLAWQKSLGSGDYNTLTQPILATEISGHAGVLFVGGGTGNVYGYDAQTGTKLWATPTGQESYSCENGYTALFGIGGSVAYDPATQSIYAVGNANTALDGVASNSLFHIAGASGAIIGQVKFAAPDSNWPSLDFAHTSVVLGPNGMAYVGTGATCDISSWRGRVAAISVPAMTVANVFFPVWDPQNTRGKGAQPWGGGGVWGWGGVSIDANGNVLTGIGNTDNGTTTNGRIVAPFQPAPEEYSGLGESFIKLSGDLTTIIDTNHPIPTSAYRGASADLDMNGTPALFTPSGVGCDPMAALQSKSGTIYLYDTLHIGSGPVAQYQLAPSSYADGFLGDPAYSPATGLLYVAVSSSNESLYPPGMIAINPGCNGTPSVVWHAAFGPDSYSPGSAVSPGIPRSVPAVSAGGVIFVGTPCTSTGTNCTATQSLARRAPDGVARKPLICCAPAGSSGGAIWALDASTGQVLNGGSPLLITSGTLRVPPTIDGDWIFVLDNSGNLYALTLDAKYAATSTQSRPVDARVLTRWEGQPHAPLSSAAP